jgi:DNA-binding LacI/PurR family transcriptional regulator/signal transduction histidine kinase
MEYTWKPGPTNRPKLTIGLLDENLNDDFHRLIMMGVFEAAKKYDVNIIRFGYFSSHSALKFHEQVDMVLEHIKQYNLDGLLFLGWTNAAAYNNYEDFIRKFSSIPILSIGTLFKDIPNVCFSGELYINEILLHLIEVHHFKTIAYISPSRPDLRNETYINTMKKFDIYDSNLYVSEKDLFGFEKHERVKKAISILLDERKVNLDAVMTVYNNETVDLLNELKRRGFTVPNDIAITSYEDGDIAKFSSPKFTTVYFPWKELGFSGCEKMIELLRFGQIPLTTIVSGKTIFRNSCGCLSNSEAISQSFDIKTNNRSLSDISEFEKQVIIDQLEQFFPNKNANFKKLLTAFLQDFENKTDTIFLQELSLQFRNTSYSYNVSNIEDIISFFRNITLPYLIDNWEDLLWSGDLFQQAQVLTQVKLACNRGNERVHTKILNQTLQEISQLLISNFSIQNLLDSLEENLFKINIPGCYIILFDSIFKNEEPVGNLFDQCYLAFEYCNGQRIKNKANEPVAAKELLSSTFSAEGKAHFRFAHLLHVSNEFMGFVLYDPGIMDEKVYQELSIHISTALRGSILLEKLDFSYKKLADLAHKEGMADIAAGILHNIGNTLNSVNASVQLMREAMTTPIFEDLTMANKLLKDNIECIENFISSDTKGKKLMQFYIKLGISFDLLQNQLLFHINRLDDKINSINDIIVAQQKFAGVNSVMEELDIVNVLEDSLRLHLSSLDKHRIEIIKDYQSYPKVLVQRTKLMNVFLNIINNAKEALLERPELNRYINLRVSEDSTGKYIYINDNGCGIPPVLLEKIFSYGYTTKKEAPGYGLHSCASYMTDMKGEIWAESDGPDKGATFVLRFK